MWSFEERDDFSEFEQSLDFSEHGHGIGRAHQIKGYLELGRRLKMQYVENDGRGDYREAFFWSSLDSDSGEILL